jgi:hypothetical protein
MGLIVKEDDCWIVPVSRRRIALGSFMFDSILSITNFELGYVIRNCRSDDFNLMFDVFYV